MSIDLANEAMQTGDDVVEALGRVVETIAAYVRLDPRAGTSYSVLDENGETVGRWWLESWGQQDIERAGQSNAAKRVAETIERVIAASERVGIDRDTPQPDYNEWWAAIAALGRLLDDE